MTLKIDIFILKIKITVLFFGLKIKFNTLF